MTRPLNSKIYLFGFLLLCITIELLGGWLTQHTVHSWYPTLIKPTWTPPKWLFGPVWTLLYLMMAVSAWRVFETRSSPLRRKALTLFGLQLFLNCLWSYLFFYEKNPLLGLIDIAALWLALASTIWIFWKVNRWASVLLWPYLIWTSYAAALNFAIWRLNH